MQSCLTPILVFCPFTSSRWALGLFAGSVTCSLFLTAPLPSFSLSILSASFLVADSSEVELVSFSTTLLLACQPLMTPHYLQGWISIFNVNCSLNLTLDCIFSILFQWTSPNWCYINIQSLESTQMAHASSGLHPCCPCCLANSQMVLYRTSYGKPSLATQG